MLGCAIEGVSADSQPDEAVCKSLIAAGTVAVSKVRMCVVSSSGLINWVQLDLARELGLPDVAAAATQSSSGTIAATAKEVVALFT